MELQEPDESEWLSRNSQRHRRRDSPDAPGIYDTTFVPVYPVPDLANEGDLDDIESELLPLAGSNTGVIFAVENDYDGDWDEDGELDDGAGESDDDGETYDRSSQSQISRAEMFDREGPRLMPMDG